VTTTFKRADELKVGDVFKFSLSSWWRVMLKSPEYDDPTMSWKLTVRVVIPHARLAGGGDKNEFMHEHPSVHFALSQHQLEVMNRE